jgi:hypothetical protein
MEDSNHNSPKILPQRRRELGEINPKESTNILDADKIGKNGFNLEFKNRSFRRSGTFNLRLSAAQ